MLSKILVTLAAVLVSFAFYNFVIKKWMRARCFFGKCSAFQYYKLNNSVLINFVSAGIWIWFNGLNVYVYGYLTGRTCESANDEPAYKLVNKGSELVPGNYECVASLERLQSFYESRTPLRTLHIPALADAPSINQILSEFQKRGIFSIDQSSTSGQVQVVNIG